MEILGFLIYCMLCIATGIIASRKGHSGFGWFVLSIIFPLLTLIMVLCLKKIDRGNQQQQQQTVVIMPPTETRDSN